RKSIHYQQQRNRSAIPLRLVSFAFLLRAPPGPFNDAGDATARPPRDPGSSASATRQRDPRRAERVIVAVRRRPRVKICPLFAGRFAAKRWLWSIGLTVSCDLNRRRELTNLYAQLRQI
ncbi:hypothetical protein, partial [Paraburkholderia atlantica]